jgi:hypothetical protein
MSRRLAGNSRHDEPRPPAQPVHSAKPSFCYRVCGKRRFADPEAQGRPSTRLTTSVGGWRGAIATIWALSAAISSCSSTVWKGLARRSIRAPIWLPSLAVSSPLPIASKRSAKASAQSAGVVKGRVVKLTGTPLRTGTALLMRSDSAAVSLSLVPASKQGREKIRQLLGELAIETLAGCFR